MHSSSRLAPGNRLRARTESAHDTEQGGVPPDEDKFGAHTSATGARKRVLLLASHLIDARDGADKQLSIAIATVVPNTDFMWFGRSGKRKSEPLSTGCRIPLLSPRGMLGPLEPAQAAGWALALERSPERLHAVMTMVPDFRRFARLRRRLHHDHPRPQSTRFRRCPTPPPCST